MIKWPVPYDQPQPLHLMYEQYGYHFRHDVRPPAHDKPWRNLLPEPDAGFHASAPKEAP